MLRERIRHTERNHIFFEYETPEILSVPFSLWRYRAFLRYKVFCAFREIR